jgi:hypothetical protein
MIYDWKEGARRVNIKRTKSAQLCELQVVKQVKWKREKGGARVRHREADE